MSKEKAIIYIQSCIRGYLQRCRFQRMKYRKSKPISSYEIAATVIQKCYRGFAVRKAYFLYRQRLNTQILCFLQQIELISNEFFNKTVKTNFSVASKNVEPQALNIFQKHKYAQKLTQCLFPPPPPLPLPLPSPFGMFSPPLPPPDAPTSIRPSMISSSVALPPPPPSLFLGVKSSPQPRPALVTANRSPSPPPISASKFAQVREIFARAEAAANTNNYHHNHAIYHHNPVRSHIQNQPLSSINPATHQVLSLDRNRSPKPAAVLDSVQEYQRQHMNNNHGAYKRFGHIPSTPGVHARPMNFHGNNYIKPRGIGAFISNNPRSILHNKPTASIVVPNYVSPSFRQPQQQSQLPKPISPVEHKVINIKSKKYAQLTLETLFYVIE